METANNRVRGVIGAFSLVAAIRVFIFSAAFPFFNNVDERAHVDLVLKYSHDNIPRGIENYSAESAHYITWYSSPEYFIDPAKESYQSPFWTLPADEREQITTAAIPIWQSRPNHESGEPPLYYGIAGAWMNLGHALGFRELSLLYWVRFLNVAFAAALVWIGFGAARVIIPRNQFFQLAVPALIALWPQSAFFSIQGDALSPVLFGIAFLGFAKLIVEERSSPLIAIGTGLAVGATCLVKTINLPLPIVLALALGFKSTILTPKDARRNHLITLGVFILSAAIPLIVWFARNHQYFGDFTATDSKIELLHWTRRPLSDWWSHPIFTLHGLTEFWSGLSASFWRGEFIWHRAPMASPFADGFYALTTAIVIATCLLLVLGANAGKDRQVILWTALLSFLSIVGGLILLSISFNFGDSPYPSREHPYFISGRLLNATAIPFFLLFGYVLDRIATWSKQNWMKWTLLGLTLLLLIASQTRINAVAFDSRYNFFHYPSR